MSRKGFKKITAAVCVAVMSMGLGVTGVAAEETVDNSARIAEIEAQIAELEAELKELKGETGMSEGDVLYEDEVVSIVYDGISGDEDDYKISVIAENLSSDKTLTVQAREMSINGFMVDPVFSLEVAPGKKGKGGMKIWGEDAEETPMSDVESIETKFIVYQDGFMDSYETDNIVIK